MRQYDIIPKKLEKEVMMEKTIAAVSTPYGRGGIAVIRISGQGAIECASHFFKPKSGKSLTETESNKTVYGDIYKNGSIIDDGMCSVYRAPHSFTGEDTVEISCHGGILITQSVLECAFLCGAEAAGPGEFSKRAFINGKLSLTQAEAVIDLIDAENADAVKIASAQSRGVLSKKIESVRQGLIELLSQIYVFIDYPDEDLSDVTEQQAWEKLCSVRDEISSLLATYNTGKALSRGIKTVIFGKPNTGKSSLLNILCHSERAIVTDIAGTTRDTVEQSCELGRVTLRLADTAGIRKSDDEVEKIGIKRAYSALEEAELVFAVFDTSRELEEQDFEIISELEKTKGKTVIYLLNKSDIRSPLFDVNSFSEYKNAVEISCKASSGIKALSDLVNSLYIDGKIDIVNDAVLSNARQYAALKKAYDSTENALTALKNGLSPDVAGLDIESAIGSLGELDGRSVGEEIVNSIFHRFCIGK